MTEEWRELKIPVERLAKDAKQIPPPPGPDDTWGEKVNALTRTIHSMQEHVDSRIQAEDEMTRQGDEE